MHTAIVPIIFSGDGVMGLLSCRFDAPYLAGKFSSGALDGGETAAFLRGQGEGVIESLMSEDKGAQRAREIDAAPAAAPAGPAEHVLAALQEDDAETEEKPEHRQGGRKPAREAAPSADAPAGVDASVIDSLLDEESN